MSVTAEKPPATRSFGFANTDLDEQLKTHGIHRLIVIGLITDTSVEAAFRFGAELAYDVTVVRDATASYSEEEMDAALDINLPNYATAIVTTRGLLEPICSGSDDTSGSVAHALL
jgi:ureidoacrylate peracid hydrolase